jgi:hypothetical protein
MRRAKVKSIRYALRLALVVLMSSIAVGAQQPAEPTAGNEVRVALTEAATAYDMQGRIALGGRLRTTALAGTQDAPTRNVLLNIENRSQFFYNYVTGAATFYDANGVRCGEGFWKVGVLAAGESAEVDTPGLRLTCTPASWRIVALNLLTRPTDAAQPGQSAPTETQNAAPLPSAPPSALNRAAMPRLEININGKTLPLQLGNSLEIVVGSERINIVVNPAP